MTPRIIDTYIRYSTSIARELTCHLDGFSKSYSGANFKCQKRENIITITQKLKNLQYAKLQILNYIQPEEINVHN